MEIKLSNEYQIISNDVEFITQRLVITKTIKTIKNEDGTETIIHGTKPTWKNIGFFGNINHCLRMVAKNILLTNKDLDIIINKLNLLDIKIEEIRELLENTRVKDLVKVMKENLEEELVESEEY